jgi:hypothetical protein
VKFRLRRQTAPLEYRHHSPLDAGTPAMVSNTRSTPESALYGPETPPNNREIHLISRYKL